MPRSKRVVVIHVLARAYVEQDLLDRARPAWGGDVPIRLVHRPKIAQSRVPVAVLVGLARERLAQQVEDFIHAAVLHDHPRRYEIVMAMLPLPANRCAPPRLLASLHAWHGCALTSFS